MSKVLIIKRLVVFSVERQLVFNECFCNGLNIIRGKNTSGKSTVFHALLYTFGINDIKDYLSEILNEKTVFRVDCDICFGGTRNSLVLVRENETLYMKFNNKPIQIFCGINSNNSAEHVKLRDILNDMFDFKLYLEANNKLSVSPIEALYLPYYISQTLGWIYLRKSFSSLDFYKNFKYDYLDYYLGVEKNGSRSDKINLEKKRNELDKEIEFFHKMRSRDDNFVVAKLSDESFLDESIDFIRSYSQMNDELNILEHSYTKQCNDLSYQQQRINILRRVLKNLNRHSDEDKICPTCSQIITINLEQYYKLIQDKNDTLKEIDKCKEKIVEIKSLINQSLKKIDLLRDKILRERNILSKKSFQQITFDKWISNKTLIKLDDNLNNKLELLSKDRAQLQGEIDGIKCVDIETKRRSESERFKAIFVAFLNELGVKIPENRFLDIYRASAFPLQGVELHKTLLAYHFAFNYMLFKNKNIHRFPFLLDSIFNEDIDIENKKKIIDFIELNKPKDTQIFITISEVKTEASQIDEYIISNFKSPKKTIQIGESKFERSFLTKIKQTDCDIINETIDLMESTN